MFSEPQASWHVRITPMRNYRAECARDQVLRECQAWGKNSLLSTYCLPNVVPALPQQSLTTNPRGVINPIFRWRNENFRDGKKFALPPK